MHRLGCHEATQRLACASPPEGTTLADLRDFSARGDGRRAVPLALWAATLFYLGVLACGLLWQSQRAGGLQALFQPPAERLVPWWAAAIAASWLLVLGPALIEDRLPPLRQLATDLAAQMQPITPLRIAVLAGLSGVCEEVLFRGPLQSALGWLPASLLFALAHGGGQRRLWVWFVFALTAGLLFGGLVLWYGSLSPAVVAHITVNAINMQRLRRYVPIAKEQR
jgi:membrane protease YdiL (CAAX protease family)